MQVRELLQVRGQRQLRIRVTEIAQSQEILELSRNLYHPPPQSILQLEKKREMWNNVLCNCTVVTTVIVIHVMIYCDVTSGLCTYILCVPIGILFLGIMTSL